MFSKEIVLGIETTCDDTGIGISRNNKVLANVVISSSQLYEKAGGVVPEIAARSHEANLIKAFENALEIANISKEDITSIAFAAHPGLPGSLHVGKVFAKTLALNLHLPLVPVNHLHSHVFSAAINNTNVLKFPLLGLVVSGGHTTIYLVESLEKLTLLDETRDDAIGEVYDKVGRALGLSYPAGPKIDKLYNPSKATAINFFNPTTNHVAFSYSGIKTAVIYCINKLKLCKQNIDKEAISSSFQHWIIHDFIKRVKFYLQKHADIQMILLGGGVSANSLLRSELQKLNKTVLVPQMEFTNDNGAMHAFYCNLLLKKQNYKEKKDNLYFIDQ